MLDYTRPTKNLWFPDQMEPVYDPLDPISDYQFKEYWKRERSRCINGFTLADGKVKISGWLYFHTVYATIVRYVTNSKTKRKSRKKTQPLLRDIDWDIINEDFTNCEELGKFYSLVGSRDFGKSVLAASRAAWTYTFFDDSECVISGGEDKFIKLATDKIEDILINIHPMFKKQRLSNDWKKEIKAGWKDKSTNQAHEKSSQSRILVRNYDGGTQTMAANGTRPQFHLIDEIGTIPNLIGCIKDSDGCWWSGGGIEEGDDVNTDVSDVSEEDFNDTKRDEGDKPSCVAMFAGCVCEGTKVYTAEGRVINIEDLKKEDGVIGYNGTEVCGQVINWFKKPTIKKCYRITTDNNTVLECSYDHPLLVTRRKNYKYLSGGKKIKKVFYQTAEYLQINDQIITPSEIPIFGNKNEPKARLFGLMVGDGNYTKGQTPTLSVSEVEIFNFVEQFSNGSNKNYQISEDRYYSQVKLSSIKNDLIANGMYGQTKFDKRLPIDIHMYDKQSICELLAGYFDADGNVYYNAKKDIIRIVLTSVVYELLEQVKYQLLKIGIHCSIVKENRNIEPTEGYEGQQNFIYRLYINQQQDIKIFKDNIQLLVESKRSNLSKIKYSKYNKFNALFEINPLNNKEGYFNRADKSNNELRNLRYETIVRVEEIGDKQVYNLNCSENHNYISNSFITRQTGGDMEVGAEAGEIFFNPEPYNLLEFENPEEPGKKMGRFVSALRAKMKFKERWTLAKYLGIDHPDLEKITILVSNEERALKEWWEPTYEKARKSGNQKTITKFLAYWPTKPSHSFLVINKNDFNVEAAKNQKRKLEGLDRTGTPIELYHDGERIVHRFTDKVPITQFPLKDQDPAGCPVMYEPPIVGAPFGLYVAGVDPYKQDTSKYSDSLGAIYIYKRMHSITDEKYQDMLVAQYVGRPDSINVWNETVRNLIKYYNAWTLSENEDYGFIQYMINKGDTMYLMEQPDWLKDITPNSSIKRQYGIPATPKIIAHLNGLLKMYTEEVVSKEIDERGSVTREVLGFSKILDPMLLDEIIKFNSEGNFDRIRAASIAIAVAKHLDAQRIVVSDTNKDPKVQAYLNKAKTSGTDRLLGKTNYKSPAKKPRINRLFS